MRDLRHRARVLWRAILPGGKHERFRVARAVFRRLPLPPTVRSGLRNAALRIVPTALAEPPLDLTLRWTTSARPAVAATQVKWILMVEWRIPMPHNNSGSHRMYQIMQILLRRGYHVFFISAQTLHEYELVISNRSQLAPDEDRLRDLGVDYVFGKVAAIDHLRSFGLCYSYALLFYPDIAGEYTPLVRAYCPNATLIFDCGDLHHLRYRRQAQATLSKETRARAERYERLERLLFRRSDLVLAISEEERTVIRRLEPQAKVAVLPNIHPAHEPEASFAERKHLLFVGHYLHPPNVDAVRYLVSEIFPLVRKGIPDAQLWIVGSNPTAEIRAIREAGVRIVGFVPSLVSTYESVRVTVAPLRYGAGLKGKIGESLAFGVPVVTTGVGAEGMGLVDGETALIANDAPGLAAAIIRLHTDGELWRRLSESGRRHIAERMSVGKAEETLALVLG